MRIRVVGGVALTAIMLAVGCGDADEELTPEGRHFCEAWEAVPKTQAKNGPNGATARGTTTPTTPSI